MNILFYDTKTYDQASFTDTLKDFPNIKIMHIIRNPFSADWGLRGLRKV